MKTLVISAFLLLANFGYGQALQSINWMSFYQVQEAMKTQKKKIFIDLYTDWCGWCKRMDATTFKDPAIVEYMNRNYYCIKFNAETRDTVRFNNFDFYDLTPEGKKGTNYLAYSLLEGRMSYPSFAILDENYNRLYVIAGYKQPEPLYGLLLLFATNEYQNYTNFLYQQLQKQQEAQKQQQGQ
jgi:thioredoxin-related protein